MPRHLFFAPFEVHFRAGGEPHAPSPANPLHYYCPSLPPRRKYTRRRNEAKRPVFGRLAESRAFQNLNKPSDVTRLHSQPLPSPNTMVCRKRFYGDSIRHAYASVRFFLVLGVSKSRRYHNLFEIIPKLVRGYNDRPTINLTSGFFLVFH